MRVSGIDSAKSPFSSILGNLSLPQKTVQKPIETNNKTISKGSIITTFIALAAAFAAGIAIIKKKHNSQLANEIIVTGSKRVNELVSKFIHDDFDASKTFKINMHIHSVYSDGELTPLEILKQAQKCAEKLPKGEKFVFSLTDHDTIEGVKIISNEIKHNPKAYKNLRFISGIEMSTSFNNSEITNGAVDIDYLIYGFDINNKQLSAEISRRKNSLIISTKALINEINTLSGKNNLSFETIQNSGNPHLKNISSNGYLHSLKKYLSATLSNTTVNIDELLTKHFGDKNQSIKANISTIEAARLSKSIGAFSSIAHPGKINFSNAGLKVNATDATNNIISSVLSNGGDAIECHYMSYSSKQNNDSQGWWQNIRNAFKQLNLQYSRTGGYDSHGKSIMGK